MTSALPWKVRVLRRRVLAISRKPRDGNLTASGRHPTVRLRPGLVRSEKQKLARKRRSRSHAASHPTGPETAKRAKELFISISDRISRIVCIASCGFLLSPPNAVSTHQSVQLLFPFRSSTCPPFRLPLRLAVASHGIPHKMRRRLQASTG